MPFHSNVENAVAELVMDCPPVNAFDSASWFELANTITTLGARADVNCLLIRAEGRGFQAGVDIKELAADSTKIADVNRGCYLTFGAIYDCPVPVISAVHGYCLGGGIGISGSSDIVIASDDATFGLPEIDRGALGAATHLMRMFGVPKTRRMLYTGESIDAQEALRLGGIDSVVPRDSLRSEAMALAGTIASKSGRALRLAKHSLNGIELLDVKESYRYEQGFTFELYTSPDSKEARDAFVEKRDADFQAGDSEKSGSSGDSE
jgi:enoyl-CoA hydratase